MWHVNEGKWEQENGIRDTKRKHLSKAICWLQTLVCKAHSGSVSRPQPATPAALPNPTFDALPAPDATDSVLTAREALTASQKHSVLKSGTCGSYYFEGHLLRWGQNKTKPSLGPQSSLQSGTFEALIPTLPRGCPVCYLSLPCVLHAPPHSPLPDCTPKLPLASFCPPLFGLCPAVEERGVSLSTKM